MVTIETMAGDIMDVTPMARDLADSLTGDAATLASEIVGHLECGESCETEQDALNNVQNALAALPALRAAVKGNQDATAEVKALTKTIKNMMADWE